MQAARKLRWMRENKREREKERGRICSLGVCSPKSAARSIDSSMREESYSFVYYEGDELSAVQSGLALAILLSVSSFLPRRLSPSHPAPATLFPTRANVWTGRPIVNVKINSPPTSFPTFFFHASTPRCSPRTQTHSPDLGGLYRTVESERAANWANPPIPPSDHCVCGKLDHIPVECITTT